MALMSFPSNISVAIDCQLHPYENTELHCMTCNLIQLGFSFLFVFLFGYIFWNFLSKLIDTINSPKVWMVTLPVPLIFTLLNILMQPREYGTMYVNRVYQMYLCYLFLAFFLLAVIYVIFYMVAMELLSNAKNEERIRLFEMQESQYYAQQRYITETSRQRHAELLRSLYGSGKDQAQLEDQPARRVTYYRHGIMQPPWKSSGKCLPWLSDASRR